MKHNATLWTLGVLATVMLSAGPARAQVRYPYNTTVVAGGAETRAGPGSSWYVTGRLNGGDTVRVTGVDRGWVQVQPPAGQVSLVAKSDVSVDGNIARAVLNNVPVFAGSNENTKHSRIQVMLPAGREVQILGTWGDTWYKVVPPPQAVVYVAGQFLRDVDVQTLQPEPTPAPPVTSGPPVPSAPDSTQQTPAPSQPTTTTPVGPTTAVPAEPGSPDAEFEKLKQTILAHRKTLDDERAKPMLDRDYQGLLKSTEALRDIARAEGNVPLEQYALATIRYLRQQITVQQWQREGRSTAEPMADIVRRANEIATASAAPTGPVVPPAEAVGLLRPSAAFHDSRAMPNMYRLLRPDGTTICYVRPAAEGIDLAAMTGQQVRVQGSSAYRADLGTTLVDVEKIEPIGPMQPPPEPAPPVAPAPPVEPAAPATGEEDIFGPRFEGMDGAGNVIELPAPPAESTGSGG